MTGQRKTKTVRKLVAAICRLVWAVIPPHRVALRRIEVVVETGPNDLPVTDLVIESVTIAEAD